MKHLADLAALRDQLARQAQAERDAERQSAAEDRRARQAATEFAQAVAGTTPLALAGRHKPAPDGAAPGAAAPGRRAPVSAEPPARSTGAQHPRLAGPAQTEEPSSYRRAGVGPDVLRKLRRSYWPVEGELDLHGLRLAAALRVTGEYLEGARARGLRCVRLIHGKGLGSADGAPVLKGNIRAWLAHHADVAAYCEAPPTHGGAGALLILLRA